MKIALGTLALLTASAFAQPLPDGYWPLAKTEPILAKTREITLAPDLERLGPGEKIAVAKLLEAGEILHTLYEDQMHPDALEAKRELERLHAERSSKATAALLDLYRLFEGPVATTLENQREPFLPVAPYYPGKNVYPRGLTRGEIDPWLEAHPESRESLLDLRSVVRRADRSVILRDLATIEIYPALDTLHPGLREKLTGLAARPSESSFYAVPYSVAWADRLMRVHRLLNEAADAVAAEDEDFARYLRNRSRDFLSDDYESGDASWVTGSFGDLNAQIGAYEVYEDELFGVKTFFSASILLRNQEESEQLRRAIAGLQELEDSLPYEKHKKVREDIPVGVYDVIADFGQARGTNTATILPNESHLARKYGRTILLRANIMRHPDLFAESSASWRAAMAAPFDDHLTGDANFYRTLWHEVGHYLGVDQDREGRSLDLALGANSSTLEEMKADLVSLFLAPALNERGYYSDERLRAVYAAGIRRVLQSNRPRPDQPYQTMQLMQWNWFLEHGLLAFDARAGELSIDHTRYHEVVGSLLERVLALQEAGDPAAAQAFIDEQTTWREDLHGVIARKIRDAQTYRFTLVRYAAMGE